MNSATPIIAALERALAFAPEDDPISTACRLGVRQAAVEIAADLPPADALPILHWAKSKAPAPNPPIPGTMERG